MYMCDVLYVHVCFTYVLCLCILCVCSVLRVLSVLCVFTEVICVCSLYVYCVYALIVNEHDVSWRNRCDRRKGILEMKKTPGEDTW